MRRDRAAQPGGDFHALVERLPAVVYVANAGVTGHWHYVSPQSEAILGVAPQELLVDPGLWLRLVHPDDRPRIEDDEARALTGTPSEAPLEYRLVRPDGRTIWVRDEALLIDDGRGRERWHGVITDITERKQAEVKLQRRAAQQAAVARLGRAALGGAELAQLMQDVVGAAVELIGVDRGAVLELTADASALLLRAARGWQAQRDAQVSIADAHDGLTVTIDGRRRPWGLLSLHADRSRDYDDGDVDFAQALANVLADAIQRQIAEDEVRHQALHDALTGLPNRVLFIDRLAHVLARRVPRVSVLFIDIDNFKMVNDSLGHAAGDALLAAVAARLVHAVRPGDTVARLGGDEFAIILEDVADEPSVLAIAESILAALRRPLTLESTEQLVTASIGIALTDAATTPSELISNADVAMYRAKERGRARCELFDEPMRLRAIARSSIDGELRRALERGDLEVSYQPVVSLGDWSIAAVEALVRWRHPQRGLIAPPEFIAICEGSGLVEQLGRWVLDEACRQAVSWHNSRPDTKPLGISVNVSARQILQRDLIEMVHATLERTGVQPMCVSLEITETALLAEGRAASALAALRDIGVRIVLDDFGTGYSSLGHLARLPIDGLKVDRSLIAGLGTKRHDDTIVKAVISMARALSIDVVAEGVEHDRQIELLRRLGCERAQGYYFCRPIPARSISALLAAGPALPPGVRLASAS